MKAKVVKAFSGAADGQHHPKMWQPGDVVEGNLAEVAVKEKWAEPVKGAASAKAPDQALDLAAGK